MWKLVAGSVLGYATYCQALKPATDLIQNSRKAMFMIHFKNKETLSSEGSSSGFFISEDGVGITSGLMLSLHKNSKVMVMLQDGRMFDAEIVVFPNAVFLGFLMVKHKGEVFPFIPPDVTEDSIHEGDHVYCLGQLASHLFFNRLYVTDTNYKTGVKEGNAITFANVTRMTGQVHSSCVGGPLLNEEGKAVAVMVNVEMGNGIGMPLFHMQKFKEENEPGMFSKAYSRFKEGVYRTMQSFSK